MRILIASDGSVHAGTATRLAAAQSWPDGSEFRLLVVDDGHLPPMAIAGDPGVIEAIDAATGDLEEIARQGAGHLIHAGWTADWVVERGRAGSTINEVAGQYDAGLIVIGSRGRGALASLALGSVSAEVVDHADRPVLVARGDQPFRRVVLADDGSPDAGRARMIAATWPVFQAAAITVISVAHVPAPLRSAIAPTVYADAIRDHAASLEADRRRRDEVLEAATRELEAAGRNVTTVAGEGDPATRILETARDVEADLILVGSRGLSAIERLLLGSVARNLLHAAPCSVLVAR
jgi:nucleotide-binding universal stress UspA family protein